MDFGFAGWFFVVVGGMVILGIAIAYGMMRNKDRTYAERAATERATHRLYQREDRPS